MQVLDPLAIRRIALPSGNVLEIMSVHEVDLEATLLERLEQRDPVHPGRFHRHRPYPTCLQPICESFEVTRKRAKSAYRFRVFLWWHGHENLFRPNVNA